MIQQAIDPDFRIPKTSMHQDCMQALQDAIIDNIVGLTPEMLEYKDSDMVVTKDQQGLVHISVKTCPDLEYIIDPRTEMTMVGYKGKPRLVCGFRGPNSEFFIETKGAVSA